MYGDYFHISPNKSASGNFAQFRAPQIEISVNYDTQFVQEISMAAEQTGLSAGNLYERGFEAGRTSSLQGALPLRLL